jgi:hypothetical protein
VPEVPLGVSARLLFVLLPESLMASESTTKPDGGKHAMVPGGGHGLLHVLLLSGPSWCGGPFGKRIRRPVLRL